MAPRIAFAADHAGLTLKNELVAELAKGGHFEPVDLGTSSAESVDYPDFAQKLTCVLLGKEAELGVLVCGTGIGMSISANKVHGIRAALCHTEFEGRIARQHNNANVLCLGQRVTGVGVAVGIMQAFLLAQFEGGRHLRRVEKLNTLEGSR